jgi:hypothetical protein
VERVLDLEHAADLGRGRDLAKHGWKMLLVTG